MNCWRFLLLLLLAPLAFLSESNCPQSLPDLLHENFLIISKRNILVVADLVLKVNVDFRAKSSNSRSAFGISLRQLAFGNHGRDCQDHRGCFISFSTRMSSTTFTNCIQDLTEKSKSLGECKEHDRPHEQSEEHLGSFDWSSTL